MVSTSQRRNEAEAKAEGHLLSLLHTTATLVEGGLRFQTHAEVMCCETEDAFFTKVPSWEQQPRKGSMRVKPMLWMRTRVQRPREAK